MATAGSCLQGRTSWRRPRFTTSCTSANKSRACTVGWAGAVPDQRQPARSALYRAASAPAGCAALRLRIISACCPPHSAPRCQEQPGNSNSEGRQTAQDNPQAHLRLHHGAREAVQHKAGGALGVCLQMIEEHWRKLSNTFSTEWPALCGLGRGIIPYSERRTSMAAPGWTASANESTAACTSLGTTPRLPQGPQQPSSQAEQERARQPITVQPSRSREGTPHRMPLSFMQRARTAGQAHHQACARGTTTHKSARRSFPTHMPLRTCMKCARSMHRGPANRNFAGKSLPNTRAAPHLHEVCAHHAQDGGIRHEVALGHQQVELRGVQRSERQPTVGKKTENEQLAETSM